MRGRTSALGWGPVGTGGEPLIRIGLLAALLCGAFAQTVAADTMSDGRAVADAFLAEETGALWDMMTPEMRSAAGTPDALRATRAELGRELGGETQVIEERVLDEAGYQIYERRARWSGSPVPVLTRVAFDAGRIAGFRVLPEPVAADSAHLDYAMKARARLPFEGAWHVVWGGRTIDDNYHAADPGQRFATDFVILRDGSSHAGDPSVLANYHCWDQPILSPAEGTVARVVDGLPDQAIGATDPDNPAGNHVVIDFGRGEFGFLAHLRRGSVSVAEGERVTAGTPVGRCGNSGNTSEPHLHFHLQIEPVLGEGVGLPARFISYRRDGEIVEQGEPRRGETVEPAG